MKERTPVKENSTSETITNKFEGESPMEKMTDKLVNIENACTETCTQDTEVNGSDKNGTQVNEVPSNATTPTANTENNIESEPDETLDKTDKSDLHHSNNKTSVHIGNVPIKLNTRMIDEANSMQDTGL